MPGLKRKRLSTIQPMALSAAQVNAAPVSVKGVVPGCRWLTITPDLALKWLEQNQNNRTIRQGHVERLASDMTAGRWRGLNGEAIRFDSHGRLVDGQHRLWACFLSKVVFESLVIDDIDAEDYSTIGIGAKKSLGDFLGPMGKEKNVHLLASTIRLVHLWRHGQLGSMGEGGGRLLPTIAEMEKTFLDNPNIRDSVNALASMNATRRLLNATYACLIHYAGTLDNKSASVQSFLDRLGSGLGLAADDPVYCLRKELEKMRGPTPGRHRVGRQYVLAMAIKAWNASKREQRMKALVFKVGEAFPVL